MWLKRNQVYIVTGIITLLIVSLILSINKTKRISAERDMVMEECALLKVAIRHPNVIEKPTVIRKIEKVKVPIYIEDTVINDMVEGLRELGHFEWVKVEEIIKGGKITEISYPDMRRPKPKNWMPYIGYNSANHFNAGIFRRIWKSIRIGIGYNSNKTFDGKISISF